LRIYEARYKKRFFKSIDATIKKQINRSVSSFPYLSIECTSRSLINLTTGFPDFWVSAPSVEEPVLNINSKKGINIPIDTIEKIIESIVDKK
jgi:hypothetical protein